MPNKRKFEVLEVMDTIGGSGPNRCFKIKYKAIIKKQWVEKELYIVSNNKDNAKKEAIKRFGGKK